MDGKRRDPLPRGILQSTVDHFSSIPIAHSTLRDPAFRIFFSSRAVTDSGRGHTLTGKTWNSPDTIQQLLSFYRPSTAPDLPLSQQGEDVRGEVRRFYTFGSDLNAHPDLLHGGVIATILDSSLGTAIGCAFPTGGGGMFTVQPNVSYKKPVRTPGTARVRAWAVKVEDGGRKVWAEAVVESDGDGGILVNARGEGLWMRPRIKEEEDSKEAKL